MPAHTNLTLDLAGLEAGPIEADVSMGGASLESLMSEHAMTEMAASCGNNGGSCCVSCCCCC